MGLTLERLAVLADEKRHYDSGRMDMWAGDSIRSSEIIAMASELLARRSSPDREMVVKPLEWEDADRGFCTKWRASALGGAYELVDFGKDDPGFAVNFYWGRPLSFWFIQGDPDEWGPTGPKMFPTLDEAKAAAQADYEARIRTALEAKP